MRYARAGALLGILACFACYTSRDPLRDPNALSPLGVHGDVQTSMRDYSGELLALTDADFILLTNEGVVVIPFSVARDGLFPSIGVSTVGEPWDRHARQLRYASRYPYGIPPAALTAILRSKSQAAPDTAKAGR